MSTPDILPFVHAQGSPGEIGRQVGVMLAPLIARHVDAWMAHVTRETGATREAIIASAASFRTPIQTYAPFLWEELEGMARGSGVPIAHLLVLQARAEVLRSHRAKPAPETASLECTTFAVGGRRVSENRV